VLGPLDYVFWLLSFLAEATVLVCLLRHRDLFRYFPIAFYILVEALVNFGRYYVLTKHGFASLQYRYFYYYSDGLMTVSLYFAVMGLYEHVFREMAASRYIRAASVMLLSGTALFSYLVVRQNQGHLTSRIVVELDQNLYFVGVVLTYLLWGAVLKLRETRTRLIQLVLALGIYFSAYAAYYALRNLFPSVEGPHKIIPALVGCWLPLAWAYTFIKIPEEARLATARLAPRTR
jgi:hypothetical protein